VGDPRTRGVSPIPVAHRVRSYSAMWERCKAQCCRSPPCGRPAHPQRLANPGRAQGALLQMPWGSDARRDAVGAHPVGDPRTRGVSPIPVAHRVRSYSAM